MTTESPVAAVHLPGGNHFDDLRIDIAASHRAIDAWLPKAPRRPVARGAVAGHWRLLRDRGLLRLDIKKALVHVGLDKAWFEEVRAYWSESLRGRPITVADYLMLVFEYRKRQQQMHALEWGDAGRHVRNWQDPVHLYATLFYALDCARRPVRLPELGGLLRPGARVLEYGCSLAPAYRTYRAYWSHVPTGWVLADIANFPFHYAKFTYAGEEPVEAMVTIAPENFAAPLAGISGAFDVIVIQEVFEHLDRPRAIAEHLMDRLKPGGHLVFDYIHSDGCGLDTPSAVTQRPETLKFLERHLAIIQGDFRTDGVSIGLCIGRKR